MKLPKICNANDGEFAGQLLLQDERDAFERRVRRWPPGITQRVGVPDAALFGRGDTMAGHLRAMRHTVLRNICTPAAHPWAGACWIEPAVPGRCITWRATP